MISQTKKSQNLWCNSLTLYNGSSKCILIRVFVYRDRVYPYFYPLEILNFQQNSTIPHKHERLQIQHFPLHWGRMKRKGWYFQWKLNKNRFRWEKRSSNVKIRPFWYTELPTKWKEQGFSQKRMEIKSIETTIRSKRFEKGFSFSLEMKEPLLRPCSSKALVCIGWCIENIFPIHCRRLFNCGIIGFVHRIKSRLAVERETSAQKKSLL